MIVNVKRKEMLAQVRRVSKAASFTNSVRELSGIHIEADNTVIRMTATNLEVAIRTTMPVTIEKNGSAVIDAKLLQGVLDKLPDENVYIELKENGQLYFSSKQAQYCIAALESKNYPKVDIPYPGNTISIKGLKSLINRSVFAVSLDNSKPVMNCVNLSFGNNGVRAIGCDGYCAVQAQGDPDCKGNTSLLIPAASMKLLASLADDASAYEIGVTGNNGVMKNVIFSDGTTLFSAKLMNGDYLDTDLLFSKLVPTATARTDTAKLCHALEHVSSIADDKVEFSFGDVGLMLRCESVNGSVSTALDAEVSLATCEPYYYTLKHLVNCTKVLNGDVTLNFTKDKMLEIQSDNMRFFQLSSRTGFKAKPEKAEKAEKTSRKKAAA